MLKETSVCLTETTVLELNKLLVGFFDLVGAVPIGASDQSEGYDLSGFIQALAEEHFGVRGIWRLSVDSEMIQAIHALGLTWERWTEQCPERVLSWLQSLHEVFSFFNREIQGYEIRIFLAKYSIAALVDLGEDFLKYQTNYIACRLFRQTEYPTRPVQLPDGEVDGFLFRSQYRWLSHKLRNAAERLQIGYSLIQFKRGCKPVSVLKRAKAIADHAKALGRIGASEDDLDFQIKEVTRTVLEVLGERSPEHLERLLPPSTSAHYEHTRAEYGALPRLRELARPHATCLEHTDICTYSLYDCSCHQWLLADENDDLQAEIRWGQVSSTFYYAAASYGVLGRYAGDPKDQLVVDFSRPQPAVNLKEEVMKQAVFGEAIQDSCDVHLVLEPFKVRTITTGSADYGWLGRYWQKAIHSQVGKNPVFEYTHAPVSFGSIRAAFGETPIDHWIVSGDYKAATDNIEMVLTKAAWRACCDWLYADRVNADAAYEIGASMLSEQTLHYAKSIAKVLGVKNFSSLEERNKDIALQLERIFGIKGSEEQNQGQLMGCILSFFLLCMINATTCRTAFEIVRGRQYRLASLPMRINGDDILFTAESAVIEEWKNQALLCGLHPSLGKNFVSREFGMINSEMYQFERLPFEMKIVKGVETRNLPKSSWATVRKHQRDEDVILVHEEILVPTRFLPYLNQGLLTGSGRVQEDSRVDVKFIYGDDRTESVGARARALIKGYSSTRSQKLIKRFIDINRDVLSLSTRGWGISEALGGLGIPCIDNHSVEGLVVASYLDRASPETYIREMAAIKGSLLNPPPHVVEALALQARVLRKVGRKRWGTSEEAKVTSLPLLVGATWLSDFKENEINPRQVINPEKAYRRLVHTAINSGVAKMTRAQLEALQGKVIVYDFDLKVISQMEAWIPRIDARLIPFRDLSLAVKV
jgi:hypothetical protein